MNDGHQSLGHGSGSGSALARHTCRPAGSSRSGGSASIAAILDAFATHDLVTMPTAHTRQEHEFLRALVSAPGFSRAVDDILVQLGNARFQDIVDRYVRGDAVTLAQVQPAWQNAVAPNNIWVDDGFFEAVRAANRGRPKNRPLRILLGDSPVDWSTVKTRADHFPWLGAASTMADVVIPARACAARGFLEERLRRIALTGLPSHEADRLRAVCGAPVTRR